ncbi:MAG: hypothetical protein WCT50_03205 [Patescibacteria group bacterium]
MKKWIIFPVALLTVFALFFIVTPGKTRTKSYYSGDALAYNNQVYIATTNTGSLEVFKLDGRDLGLVAKTKPFDPRFGTYGEFFDTKLVEENGHLYAYAVSNYTIYKYEVMADKLNKVRESSNTYWEWYNRIDKFGENIVTVSAKGVKVFNSNLDSIVAHDFKNSEAPYNVSGNDRFYLSINETTSKLEVYDVEARSTIKTIPLNFKFDKGNRRAFQDEIGYVYVVDDYYAKKFDLSGKLLGSFKHLDYQGFDISGTANDEYIYFSNGVGVVKLDKNMNEQDYAWTGNMGGRAGWAMGLKAVYAGGDKIIVFNNSNILVLDDKLNKIAAVSSTEEADTSVIENLFLKLDNTQASLNSSVVVSGGGFLPNEELSVSLDNRISIVKADTRGRFSSIVKIPANNKKGAQDIRVDGASSKLHYSVSLRVE